MGHSALQWSHSLVASATGVDIEMPEGWDSYWWLECSGLGNVGEKSFVKEAT